MQVAASSPNEDNRPMVIEVGLPRSGSKAVYDYFACQDKSHNLHPIHYCCDEDRTQFPCPTSTIGETVHANAVQHRPWLTSCVQNNGGTRVLTGWAVESSEPYGYFVPQHFGLSLLHEEFASQQEVVWILPQRRNAAAWATSVLHWYSETERWLRTFGYDTSKTTIRRAPAHDQSEERVYKGLNRAVKRAYSAEEHEQKRQRLEEIYHRHTHRVRAFAEDHGVQLVEVNIDDAIDTRTKLENAFPNYKPGCWSFDPSTLDDDWKNLTLPF